MSEAVQAVSPKKGNAGLVLFAHALFAEVGRAALTAFPFSSERVTWLRSSLDHFCESPSTWYVQFGKKQISLGKDEYCGLPAVPQAHVGRTARAR